MNRFRKFNLILISTIFLVFGIEYIAGKAYKHLKNNTQLEKNLSFHRARLANLYEGYTWEKDYFDDLKINKPSKLAYFPYAMWVAKDRRGMVEQDSNGIRTSYQPIKNGKKVYRIYIFGGSTVENIQVPNESTIASILVKKLSESPLKEKYDFEIINFGNGAYNNTQSLIRFLYEYQRDFVDYGKPSHLIFYDGGNDIFSGVYLERPGIHDAFDRIKLRYENLLSFLALKVREYINNNVNLIKLINHFAKKNEEDLRYFETRKMNYQDLAIETKEIYQKNIELLRKIVIKENVNLDFFIQPTIYTQKNQSSHDKSVLEIWNIKRPKMNKAFLEGHKELSKLSDNNQDVHNLSSIYDNIDSPIFKDYIHTGPLGIEIVANEIYQKVFYNLSKD